MTMCVYSALQWWCDFPHTFNGVVPLLEEWAYVPLTIGACTTGAGWVFGSEWFQVAWRDDQDVALQPAACLFVAAWRGKKVTVYRDNQATVALLTTKESHVMHSLRNIFWLPEKLNFAPEGCVVSALDLTWDFLYYSTHWVWG